MIVPSRLLSAASMRSARPRARNICAPTRSPPRARRLNSGLTCSCGSRGQPAVPAPTYHVNSMLSRSRRSIASHCLGQTGASRVGLHSYLLLRETATLDISSLGGRADSQRKRPHRPSFFVCADRFAHTPSSGVRTQSDLRLSSPAAAVLNCSQGHAEDSSKHWVASSLVLRRSWRLHDHGSRHRTRRPSSSR